MASVPKPGQAPRRLYEAQPRDQFARTYRLGQVTGTEAQQEALAKAAKRYVHELAAKFGPRPSLSAEIAKHGGPTGMMAALGIKPKDQGYNSIIRTFQRHSESGKEGKQMRGITKVGPTVRARYEQVFGKERTAEILDTPDALRTGRALPRPKRGHIRFGLLGVIHVSGDRRDKPRWVMTERLVVAHITELLEDPMQLWLDQNQWLGDQDSLVRLDAAQFIYSA